MHVTSRSVGAMEYTIRDGEGGPIVGQIFGIRLRAGESFIVEVHDWESRSPVYQPRPSSLGVFGDFNQASDELRRYTQAVRARLAREDDEVEISRRMPDYEQRAMVRLAERAEANAPGNRTAQKLDIPEPLLRSLTKKGFASEGQGVQELFYTPTPRGRRIAQLIAESYQREFALPEVTDEEIARAREVDRELEEAQVAKTAKVREQAAKSALDLRAGAELGELTERSQTILAYVVDHHRDHPDGRMTAKQAHTTPISLRTLNARKLLRMTRGDEELFTPTRLGIRVVELMRERAGQNDA